MSVQALVWVLEHSRATHSERLTLISLANHAGSDGADTWPSIATIAREAGLGESTVRGALERLKELGEIEETGVSSRRTRAFRLTMTPADSGPPQDLHPRRICTPADSGPVGVQDLAADPAGSAPEPSVTALQPSIPPRPRRAGGAAGRKGLRSEGTSPRQLAELARVRSAVDCLASPDDDHARTWERVRSRLRSRFSDHRWPIHLEPLSLAGVDRDVLVLDWDRSVGGCWPTNFERQIISAFAAEDAMGRLATPDEHRGLTAMKEEELVA